MRLFQIIFVLLLVGLAGFLGIRRPEFWSAKEEEKESPDRKLESPTNSSAPSQNPEVDEFDFRFTRHADDTVDWNPSIAKSRELHQDPAPERDLDLIDQIFAAYRLVYRENPVGTENFEFVAPLLGDNPKQVIFIPRDHPAVKDNTLHDRWGAPYHFHPLSGQKLDIRSAGPDGKLWTDDDLSLDPAQELGDE